MPRRRCIVSFALLASLPLQAQSPSIADGRRSDLAAFRRDFLGRDNSYSSEHRAQANDRLTRLEAQVATASPAHFELELARIVALADNGHTNSPASFRSRRYARVPIRFVPFGDQFYILRTDTAHADLLGARLLSIDGKSLPEVREVAHTLWGGSPSWRDRSVPFFLESPDQMQALGVATRPDAVTYRLELRGGRTVERRIVADPPDAGREMWGSMRWLYADPLDDDRGRWRMLASGERTPWAFRDPATLFRVRVAMELDAMVVQLRANRDGAGQRIAAFLDSTVAEILRAGPQHLILDLRMNGGGDLNNTREFVKKLPTLVPGRVFVLTSPWTFSAAISTVGYLKQAGGNRVTIVGEMVGDRLEFWAEGSLARFPYSGAAASFSTERHDYRNGCKAFTDCHGSVIRNPISVASLAPDIEAPMTIETFIAGRDPGMEAIAREIRKQLTRDW